LPPAIVCVEGPQATELLRILSGYVN